MQYCITSVLKTNLHKLTSQCFNPDAVPTYILPSYILANSLCFPTIDINT